MAHLKPRSPSPEQKKQAKIKFDAAVLAKYKANKKPVIDPRWKAPVKEKKKNKTEKSTKKDKENKRTTDKKGNNKTKKTSGKRRRGGRSSRLETLSDFPHLHAKPKENTKQKQEPVGVHKKAVPFKDVDSTKDGSKSKEIALKKKIHREKVSRNQEERGAPRRTVKPQKRETEKLQKQVTANKDREIHKSDKKTKIALENDPKKKVRVQNRQLISSSESESGSEDLQKREDFYTKHYSQIIRKLPGYGRRRASPLLNTSLDDTNMEASWQEIEREELRSQRIGRLEDKLEEERLNKPKRKRSDPNSGTDENPNKKQKTQHISNSNKKNTTCTCNK